MKIGFGKYKGKDLSELPQDYLEYLLTWNELFDSTRSAIENELDNRKALAREGVTVELCREIITAGLHALAKKYHPDLANGNAEKMKAINHSADFIKILIKDIGLFKL